MATHQPSQNEIWDDSALVQSWNDALNEYKKYHSIAAKGERVEDVLDAAEKAEEAEFPSKTENNAVDETTGLPPWQSVETDEPLDTTVTESISKDIRDEALDAVPKQQSATLSTAPPPNVSQALLNSVQDENLKNLMMSWYYAGYYTGLYEGQQKAQTRQETAA